jgi:hypothetical protein
MEFRLSSMCRVLMVHRNGYYAWLREPLSPRAKVNEALTLTIREFYDQSMGSRMQTSLVLDALTMAVWRRRTKDNRLSPLRYEKCLQVWRNTMHQVD